MADLQHLIKTILADTKFDPGGNSASKVYRDEPILLTASQVERYTPSKYLAMRKLARNSGLYQASEAQIFYEQGRFMEDFEDDFDYQGDFQRYFPTYQSMNDQQLRGYFSWRTKVRRGRVEKTRLSFAFVYIYELLNQIGPRSPEEGFHALKKFWLAYQELAPQISSYARIWLKDYVVYHNLAPSLLDDLFENSFDQAVLTLLNHRSRAANEVFSALNFLSSYKLENSRFFKQYPDEVKGVACDVFSSFSDYYGQKRKKNICEKFFGKIYASPYFMFKSAVFHSRALHQDYVYIVNDFHKYMCKNGSWTCERFFRYGDKNRPIGDLLKTVDFHLRQKYDFKSGLKPAKTTKTLEAIICKAIDSFREKQGLAVRAEIEIDLSKLQNIREASLETQSKLIIEEADPTETPGSAPEKAGPENEAGLNKTEYGLLSRLLYGRPYEDYARSKGLMLSVLIDAINENLFDRFGDTVIIEAEGRPELVEDYVAELKDIIKE